MIITQDWNKIVFLTSLFNIAYQNIINTNFNTVIQSLRIVFYVSTPAERLYFVCLCSFSTFKYWLVIISISLERYWSFCFTSCWLLNTSCKSFRYCTRLTVHQNAHSNLLFLNCHFIHFMLNFRVMLFKISILNYTNGYAKRVAYVPTQINTFTWVEIFLILKKLL